jgi:hypothetical protein
MAGSIAPWQHRERRPWLYRYWKVRITQKEHAFFKQNRWTGALFVFQWNCAPDGHNCWNETGYGWGRWLRVT